MTHTAPSEALQPSAMAAVAEPLMLSADASASIGSRFRQAATWAIVGAVASRGLNMAAWFACARILGKSAFGHLGIVQSTTGALGVVSGLGLGLTATKYIAELRVVAPQRAGRILGLGHIVALLAGAVIALALLLGAPFLAARTLGDASLKTPLRLGAGLVLFGALNGFQTGALVGFEAFRTLAHVGFWTSVLALPCIAGGSHFFGVNGAVGGCVLALAICSVANQGALRQQCARSGVAVSIRGCASELPMLLQFSLPALLGSALVSPAMWLCDTWLVHQRDGFAQLGLYAAADRWRLAILFIPASMAGPMLSMLANFRGAADSGGYRKMFRLNLRVTLGSVAVLAILGISLAPELMRFFGSAYQAGSTVLAILAVSAVAEAANTFLGQRLVTRSMWTRFRFDLLLVAILLTTAFFLIPRWQSVGLAAAYALAFLVTSLSIAAFDWNEKRI